MKYFTKIVVAIVCLFLVPIRVFAVETNSFYLEEIGISVQIPSDYIVIPKDFDSLNPDLIAFGFDEDAVRSQMEENSVSLYILDEELTFEITISTFESRIDNIKSLDDTDLLKIASGLEADYEKQGITLQGIEIYENQHAKFIKIKNTISQNGMDVYRLVYWTIHDRRIINITMQSYYGEVDDTKEDMLKEIVDSIDFGDDSTVPDTQVSSEDSIYTDSETGLSFTIPAGWSQKPLSTEGDFVDAKFTPNAVSSASFIYESVDSWEQFSASDKISLGIFSREDLNTGALSNSFMADVFGISEDEVSLVTYADKEYYKINMGVMGETIEWIMFISFNNGYMYCFQFVGQENDVYYSDFEEVMNSVKCPETSTDSIVTPSDSGINPTDSSEIPSGDGDVPSGDSVAASGSASSSNYRNQGNVSSLVTSYRIGHWIGSLLSALFIAAFAQFLPMCTYRALKSALSRGKAAWMTVVDAVLIFVVLLLMRTFNAEALTTSFIAVSFWGVICYVVLTRKRSPKSEN